MRSFKLTLVVAFLAIAINRYSEALFLGNIIGCSTLACRIAALETDVGRLRQSVNKLEINIGSNMHNMNIYRPPNQNQMNQLPGFNTNPNNGQQGNNQQGFNQMPNTNNLPNGQQQQQSNNPQLNGQQPSSTNQDINNPNRVNYALLQPDYSSNQQQQQLQRRPTNGPYQSSLGNQFIVV